MRLLPRLGLSSWRSSRWQPAALSLTVLLMASATTGLPRQGRSTANQDWERAAREISRLSPSEFKELPAPIMKQLESRGCTIPQSAEFSAPHNVITGEFARKAQKDWAVLCSTQGKSTILVFWGGPAKCFAELASAKDRDYLQGIGDGRTGYSRKISPLGAKQVFAHSELHGGPKPPPPDHQGIDDAFVGKASVIHYCHQGVWRELEGAD